MGLVSIYHFLVEVTVQGIWQLETPPTRGTRLVASSLSKYVLRNNRIALDICIGTMGNCTLDDKAQILKLLIELYVCRGLA